MFFRGLVIGVWVSENTIIEENQIMGRTFLWRVKSLDVEVFVVEYAFAWGGGIGMLGVHNHFQFVGPSW